jgi:hypothetical protein
MINMILFIIIIIIIIMIISRHAYHDLSLYNVYMNGNITRYPIYIYNLCVN